MKGQAARLVADGGWGQWRPSYAYDLFKGNLWKNATSQGLVRYGREPSGDDDTRPLGLAYEVTWSGRPWTAQGDTPALLSTAGAVKGGTVYSQPDAKPNQAKAYRSSFSVPKNAGWSIQAFLNEPPQAQVLELHQWRLGVAGQGMLFQIRSGTPEVAFLSDDFNTDDLAALHVLWAIEHPTLSDRDDIDDLVKKIFVDFESLNFERSTGKSDWYNSLWAVTFIAEDRGNLHIILEGADATSKENRAILDTGKAGTLWDNSQIDMFSAGGAFWLREGYPLHVPKGTAEYGPHREGYYFADALGDATFDLNAHFEEGQTGVVFEKFDYENTIDFGIRGTLTSTGRRRTPWVYGASSRLPPGERDGTNNFEDPEFDTDQPYEPVSGARLEPPVIIDIEPSWDGGLNKSTFKVTVMDPSGLFSSGTPLPTESIAWLTVGGESLVTSGIVTNIEQTGMRSLQRDTSNVFVSGSESELAITIANGWELLAQYECSPPPIGDNRTVGTHLRAILKTAGFRDWQIAGVSADDGPIIKGAVLGKDFACRCDGQVTCADAIRAVMESFGLFWRFYQDRHGVFQYKRQDTTSQGTFSSSPSGFNAMTEPGRLRILKPIDLSYDRSNYFNDFVVVGGENGELVRHMPGSLSILKRRKTKTLTNSALRDESALQYALLSMEWMYGRGGRRAVYDTFFHTRFDPGHRLMCDGSEWEVEGLSGGNWAKDQARFMVLEV